MKPILLFLLIFVESCAHSKRVEDFTGMVLHENNVESIIGVYQYYKKLHPEKTFSVNFDYGTFIKNPEKFKYIIRDSSSKTNRYMKNQKNTKNKAFIIIYSMKSKQIMNTGWINEK